MKKRSLFSLEAVRFTLSLGFFLASVSFLSAKETSSAPSKPEYNVILINVDDLGWAELGCYGQEKIQTPHIDSLAKEGQRWTHFYSGAPVCAPSRNVLLTGRHSGTNDIQDLKRVSPKEKSWETYEGDWPMSEGAYTLPQAMKERGYITGVFGKWGMGDYGTSGAPDKHAIDDFYGYTDHKMCHTYYPNYLWDNGKKEVINPHPILGHAIQRTQEVLAETYRSTTHASEKIIEHLLSFIGKQAEEKKPFFIYYAPCEAHVALQPLQKYIDKYPVEWDKKPYRGEKGYLPHPRPRAAYAAMISTLDDYVGKIRALLKEKGLEKKTLIVLTSDNGTTHDVGGVDHRFFNSVRGLRGLKGQMYEGGLRVPGIFVLPEVIPAGTVISQPAYHADILPTLCKLVDAEPKEAQGEDLTPILKGKQVALENRSPMIWTGGGYTGQAALRFGAFKVIRRNLFADDISKVKPWEVYNIEKDPEEKKDIALEHPELIKQAIQILDQEYRASKGYKRLKYDAP